jgi:hypothetical protein
MIDQIKHAVGVAPFVVIPAHDFYRFTQYAGATAVHKRGVGVALEINGYQGLIGIA